jgi:hypothetical protein
MMERINLSRLRAVCAASALALAMPFSAMASTLSDNTAQVSADALAVTSSNWLAASFTSDANYSMTTLDAVLSASTDSGAATLALYSSDASTLIPDSLLATFQPVSSAGGLTFTVSGVTLQSNTSYWLVLSNASGTSQWSWTEASEGTGTGFTGVWANSDDAGGVWFTNSSLYPLQASVSVSAVPEPTSMLLWLGGLSLLLVARRHVFPLDA